MSSDQPERIQSYRDLKVWQKAMDIAVDCYALTKNFPREDMFGAVSQIRRASASVAANIAEGWGRNGPAELARFCDIAQGSIKELETHLILSMRNGIAPAEQIESLLERTEEVGRMLSAFIRSVKPSR